MRKSLPIFLASLSLLACLSGFISGSKAQPAQNENTCFSLPNLVGAPGSQVAMGLQVSDADAILSLELTVLYPADQLKALSVALTPFSQSMYMEKNLSVPGKIRIAMAGAAPISGSGEMLVIGFELTGTSEHTAAVELTGVRIDETIHPTCINNGSITIHINKPPIADAGPDQTVAPGSLVVLDASNSRDIDGSIASYAWTQISGPEVTIDDTRAGRIDFLSTGIGSANVALIFQVTVTDLEGAQASDTCIVNVAWTGSSPVAVAGADQTVAEGQSVILDGAASFDLDGPVESHAWSQIRGETVSLTGALQAQAGFSAPAPGESGKSLTFQVTVTDQEGLLGRDRCIVNVVSTGAPPVANAGQSQQVEEGVTVTLDGSETQDIDDGGIASYYWEQTHGMPVALSDPTAIQPTFIAPDVGPSGATLIFLLTATDNSGLQSRGTTQVSVSFVNRPPTISAPPSGPSNGETDQSLTFTASADDPDGDLVQCRFDWGDGGISQWTNDCKANHAWTSAGSYCVKAQASDDKNAESQWSECASISISRPATLTVTITPQEAIAAGATWRVDSGAWQQSGATVSGLSVGDHTVEFSSVAGWITPLSQTIPIANGQTATATGTYTIQTGSLAVTIEPLEAVSAGAMWQVDGGAWQQSGAVVGGLSVGQHTVRYSDITNWHKPGDQIVTIQHNRTAASTGTYTRHSGSLTVTITPQGAIAAGAMWRVDAGAWKSSSDVVSGLSVGNHTVEFSSVAGWITPLSQSIPIVNGQTATATGTYTIQTGSLAVTIEPPEAVSAGAMWQVDGGAWQQSGAMVGGLSVGQHTVRYSDITNWYKPGDQIITIQLNQTATSTGTYTRHSGSLAVMISPQEAITAGATWRVDSGAWQQSGATVSGLSVGDHTVEFSSISGWITPLPQTIPIANGQTATATGTYTIQTGSLAVTIEPLEAVSAGAMWQVDGGAWQQSGAVVGGLSVGQHTVRYSDITNWYKPGDQIITIQLNQTATSTGTYTRHSGSLTVMISPQEAIAAGAMWRVDAGAWKNSSDVVSGLSVGDHTVEFSTITGWITPLSQTIPIANGQTAMATGTYTIQTGSLAVTIEPPEAVSAGAMWQVDGGAWQQSGAVVGGLSVGQHTVRYSDITNWYKPGDQIITIQLNQTATSTGTYTRHSGSLTVMISPQEAIAAGAMWRVDAGAWKNSSDVVSGLSVGDHTVEFSSVAGWITPLSQTIPIANGQTAMATGTYTIQTGSLAVTIEPPEAVSAGAMWQVDGGAWQQSGAVVGGLSVGQHTVRYSDITNWYKPGDQIITIQHNQTATSTGTYTRHSGSLTVMISPQEAITAGATWRVDSGAWQQSGATVSGLSVGDHTVEFSSISGWITPLPQTIPIANGQTAMATGTYTIQTGSLAVTIEPPEAVSAGAMWQVDGGAWQQSGAVVGGLSVGQHTISYKKTTGWTESGPRKVEIQYGQCESVTGTYLRQTGALKVTIRPPEAVRAGAQWSLDGVAWHNSGESLSGLPIGECRIRFKLIQGWTKPQDATAIVKNDKEVRANGIYVRDKGSLKVIITPTEAVKAGALWKLDNGAWQKSGKTLGDIPTGQHVVAFKKIKKWSTPRSSTVTIRKGQTKTLKAKYVRTAGAINSEEELEDNQ